MFERYTDRARRSVVLAQEEARMLNHNYVGTEHLLLGLIHEGEAVAAQVLASAGVTLEAAREQVEGIIGRGEQMPARHLPFTPRAKKVNELALREALQLGCPYIGTEHVLLGLIREGEGVGVKVLIKLGVSGDDVRSKVLETLHGYERAEGKQPELTHIQPSTPPRAISALTAAVNAIANKVDLPLDLAANLLHAVAACEAERAAEAVAAERERIARLAEEHHAHYWQKAMSSDEPPQSYNAEIPFADLIRGAQPGAGVPETQPISEETEA